MKKNKSEGKVKGEVTTLSYKKGEKLPEWQPLDEGTYSFVLKNAGKPFPKGWKTKPGKFPNKKVTWEALDTEDEKTGNNKTVNEYISLSPGALPIGPIRLAYAAQFDIELKQGPKKKPGHPSVRENAATIDEMLQYIKKEELTLRGDVTHEEFNGNKMARIRWLPPEELEEATEEDEEVDEDESGEDESENDDDYDGDEDVEESDDSDDDDEAESDDDDEAEAADEDEDDDEDDDDDADEDGEDEPTDDEDEGDPLDSPGVKKAKKAKTAKKAAAKPAAKKPAKKSKKK